MYWLASSNSFLITSSTADVLANTTITAGDLLRLGVIAATGNSFCVILISNDSHGRVTREGWQATSEALTQAGKDADCGADVGGETLSWDDKMFYAMPDTPGTDSKPSAIVDAVDTTVKYSKP